MFCILQPNKRTNFTRRRIRHHFCFSKNDVYVSIFHYFLDNLGTQNGIERGIIHLDDELRNIRLINRKLIAVGGFGGVYLSEIQGTGCEIAVKQIYVNSQSKRVEENAAEIQREIEILKTINHKSIVKFLGMLKDHDSVSILMEYVKGGTIHDKISAQGALEERVVRKHCLQILEGIAYLHNMSIVHRDLKCANILLDELDNCKLTDFGISKYGGEIRSASGCDTFCGSVYWMSPQSIQGQTYGSSSDIWSFGCTLEMLNTVPPYKEFNWYVAAIKIVQNDLLFSMWHLGSLQDIYKSMS